MAETQTKTPKKVSLAYAGLITTLGMFAGRLAGFLREVFIAGEFGASAQADSAILLLTLPDLLIGLFVGGAANIVFIPYFQKLKDKERFRTFFIFQIFTFIIFSVVSFLFAIGAESTIHILAPGMSAPFKESLLPLFRWTLIAVPITAGTAMTRAFLQSDQRFLTTAFANFIYNLAVILCVVLLSQSLSIEAVVIGIILGTLIRWLTQVFNILSYSSIKWHKVSLTPYKELITKYSQALGAGTILILFPYIARSIASSFFGDGAIAVFNYSFKLVELPFGVAISVFAIAIFPRLSQLTHGSQSSQEESLKLISNSLSLLFFLSIPLAISLIWLLSGWSLHPQSFLSISKEGIQNICLLAIMGLLALPIRGLSSIHIAILSARGDTKGPLYINTLSLFVLAASSYFMASMGHIANIGFALLITYILVCLLEAYYLKTKHHVSTFKDLFSKAFAMPLTLSLLVFSGIYIISIALPSHPVLRLILAATGGLICLTLQLFINKELKSTLLSGIRKKKENSNSQ